MPIKAISITTFHEKKFELSGFKIKGKTTEMTIIKTATDIEIFRCIVLIVIGDYEIESTHHIRKNYCLGF